MNIAFFNRDNDNPIYYGWYIAITLAVTETISWGIIFYAFSVLLTPMEAELGWSRATLTGAFSLMFLIAGVMGVPVGIWIDKHGARLLMTVGSIGASLLVLLWSRVQSPLALYAVWAGLGVCASAVLYEPAFAVIAKWFQHRRSQAMAIVTFAAGFASTIFLPLTDLLNRIVGWRDALVILAITLALTTIPLHALLLRRNPEDMGLLPDGGEVSSTSPKHVQKSISARTAFHSSVFWRLTVAFALTALSAGAVRVHFIPYLIDRGIDASVAAGAAGFIGAMQVAGRVVFAPLDNRIPTQYMTVGVFGLLGISVMVLLTFPSSVGIILSVILFGAAVGAMTLTRPALLAEMYGSAQYGRIASVMSLFVMPAVVIAPFVAGVFFDQFGTYDPLFWVLVGVTFVAAGVMLFSVQLTNPIQHSDE